MSKLLNQEEIDALMNSQSVGNTPDPEEIETPQGASISESQDRTGNRQILTNEEMDALGEIGNISMGSASTTLSELLSQKVSITSPKVKILSKQELFDSFKVPYMVIQVDFAQGLNGYNLLVIQLKDAAVMASLMMGGDGTPMSEEISDMEVSAASEAMNMMIGTASTSLSQIFNRPINISPPVTNLLKNQGDPLANPPEKIEDIIVVVSFNLKIGDMVDTDIMQIMGVETAKEEADLLLGDLMGAPQAEPSAEAPSTNAEDLPSAEELEDLANMLAASQGTSEPAAVPSPAQPAEPVAAAPAFQQSILSVPSLGSLEQRNLELILDIPLKVSIILGRTRRPIKDVLKIAPGSVVELDSLADEPVEVLVNGTLVATGEVVVVNENFGVRITNIISPIERIKRLGH
ncbi:flagellar motor switch phosphatase FliY [Desulforamulus ruminis]|uniref:Flagellar motor switch protein FliN n=1 Tax=Desulforamulus ruminis (strain ATCC 23193 / DSM 2154 / NCIMB 8452 / DL) TaxID=696281 RepID=F6DNU5_DESRL|nr:flagellar motor switch phosphatase FliY [Desulforamulus ruminis]AEG59540.1 flagellar motor switch protein FliN [Desulforamulus ruminis DSM 2154]